MQDFWDHFEELRRRFIRALVVCLFACIGAFFFKGFIFDDLLFAPLNNKFITYNWLCWFGNKFGIDGLCVGALPVNLMNTEIGGQFKWHLMATIVAGIVISFPYFIFQIWRFVQPALSPKEKKFLRGFSAITSGLFFLGILFGYYIVLPLTLAFLSNYTISPQIENHITLASYLSTTVFLPLTIGMVFELPLLVYFLSKIGFITSALMRKFRKHAFVLILIVAGIITPSTDVFSQLLVGLPLYVLFEISIWVAVRNEKSEAKL